MSKKNIVSIVIAAIIAANSIVVTANAVATDINSPKNAAYQSANNFKFKVIYDGTKNGYIQLLEYKGTSPNVIIPSTIDGRPVKSIHSETFKYYKEYIQTLTIPEGIEDIWGDTFSNCTNLRTVELPSTLTKIDNGTFSSCKNLKNVTIKNGTTEIGNYAFKFCTSLESIVIPGSVKIIGDRAFADCDKLKYVTLEKGIEEIGLDAFEGTSIEKIEIPESITYLDTCFTECEKLKEITSATTTQLYCEVNNTLCKYYNTRIYINEDDNYVYELVRYPAARSDTSYTIPKTISRFDESAFNYSTNLRSLYIPITVNSISKQFSPYYGCSNLTDIYFEGTSEEWENIGGKLNYRIEYYDEYGNKAWFKPTLHFNSTISGIPKPQPINGDVNNDGKTNAKDATTILKHVVGIQKLTGTAYSNADVNGDGKVNAADATAILKMVVGIR